MNTDIQTDPGSGRGIVRPMRADEKNEVKQVMIRSFNRFAGLFFDFGDQAFVYELDGRICGGITLSAFRIDKGRRGGIVKWMFTLPETRGQGAAGAMLDRAQAWFDQQGCDHQFACVEGYNTPSSNQFAKRRFQIMSFMTQVRTFGWSLPRVWLRTVHTVDVGHFLWERSVETSQDSKTPIRDDAPAKNLHWLAGLSVTILLQSVFGVIMTVRWGQPLTLSILWQIPLVLTLLLGGRLWRMFRAARGDGLSVVYRPWETGLLLSGTIPLLFGGIFVVPGGVYPDQTIWRYRELLPRIGKMAFAGTWPVVLAALLLHGLTVLTSLPPGLNQLADVFLFYARGFLLFEVVFVFFPFKGYNGSQIRNWSQGKWFFLLAGTFLLWGLSFLS